MCVTWGRLSHVVGVGKVEGGRIQKRHVRATWAPIDVILCNVAQVLRSSHLQRTQSKNTIPLETGLSCLILVPLHCVGGFI